ncbi:hypothetical protein N8388_04735 [Octadecabacter sp.]|nr:hypothetical protein [Octadecabacter sp.]MDB4122038.1 hypothetical protein [Octadecabacter sp.]MDC1398546.1 hypothetical protein [Octadecabacter sp.]MDC1500529.1 hypothetical protein [Octadecabacter sp.]
MFRNLFNALIIARQASAATQVMNFMSDRQLKDLGYDRSTFVAAQTAIVVAELAAKDEAAQNSVPVNANLVGAL